MRTAASVRGVNPGRSPEPTARPEARMPGLDGLRGVAVAAVLLYHGGVNWARGGFLGVEAFFVLSGFLITSLLVQEWRRSSTIRLRSFWARRARRLLPALFCAVAAVGLYLAVAGPDHAVPGFSGDGISTLLYYGNWNEILNNSNYFVQNGPVSPLQHTWSLAIEEQFYIVWPLVVLAALRIANGRSGGTARSRRRSLGGLCLAALAGAVLSAGEMALLYRPVDPGRVYYGTDTRAQALLLGAALAFAFAYLGERAPSQPFPRPHGPRAARSVLALAGTAGGAVLVAAVALVPGTSRSLYRFGFLAVDVAVALIIAAVALLPGSLVGRVLSTRPLNAIGTVSYGVYLWHFPLFLWLTPAVVGFGGPKLLAVRLACVGAVAVASYFLVEQPIRQRRLPAWLLVPVAPAGAAVAGGAVLLASNAAVPTLAASASPPPALHAPMPKAAGGTHQQSSWRGTGASCSVVLSDSSSYFEAAAPTGRYTAEVTAGLATHQTDFGGRSRISYSTCPPVRVLFVGDSIAFTLAFGMLAGEQHYGVELAGAPLEGCGFNTNGSLLINGDYRSLPATCPTEYKQWDADARRFHPDAVVVEMGWRDAFDWQVAGRPTHLGDPAFDAAVDGGIDRLVTSPSLRGVPILLLTVPWGEAPPEPDGSPAPQGLAQRHELINDRLRRAAARHPAQVKVLDIDRYVSPGNRFDRTVDGQLCRIDGLHFTQFCAEVLQPYVLGEVRQMVAARTG